MISDQIDVRIRLLEEFLALLRDYDQVTTQLRPARGYVPPDVPSLQRREAELRSQITRKSVGATLAVTQAGVGIHMTMRAPAAIGGYVQHFDVFANVLGLALDQRILPHTIATTERGIGAYEVMKVDPSLSIGARGAIDIVDAIGRALRPSFKEPPTRELQVQDAVEQILRAIGVDYVRDKEVAPVGITAFKPDFTIVDGDLAVEIKLATTKHREAEIQRELAEDVAGYRTKWKHLLAVVYDSEGVIVDAERMKAENQRHFGVTVLIIKH